MLHARLLERREEARLDAAHADPVAEEPDLHPARRGGDEGVADAVADVVRAEDVRLEHDRVAGLGDRVAHRVEGGRPVVQEHHLVAAGDVGGGDAPEAAREGRAAPGRAALGRRDGERRSGAGWRRRGSGVPSGDGEWELSGCGTRTRYASSRSLPHRDVPLECRRTRRASGAPGARACARRRSVRLASASSPVTKVTRSASSRAVLLDPAHQLEAALRAQPDVDEQDVRIELGDGAAGAGEAAGEMHGVSATREPPRHRRPDQRLVVHVQQRRHRPARRSEPAGQRAGCKGRRRLRLRPVPLAAPSAPCHVTTDAQHRSDRTPRARRRRRRRRRLRLRHREGARRGRRHRVRGDAGRRRSTSS